MLLSVVYNQANIREIIMAFAIAMVLRPIALFILLACILLPIRYAVIKWMPEGRMKRLFLIKV